MCALHCCPFFASNTPSLCVCSMKHFHSCRVKFRWIFDAAPTAYSELKPLRTSLPTQTLIPWLFGHNYRTRTVGASLVTQLVKNLPAVWEVWVWSLGWEDSLEKGKTTHSNFLAWRIPWNCIVHGVTKSRTRLRDFHFHRTVDAVAFNCYPIRWKALDVQSVIPHTLAFTVSCPKIMW